MVSSSFYILFLGVFTTLLMLEFYQSTQTVHTTRLLSHFTSYTSHASLRHFRTVIPTYTSKTLLPLSSIILAILHLQLFSSLYFSCLNIT